MSLVIENRDQRYMISKVHKLAKRNWMDPRNGEHGEGDHTSGISTEPRADVTQETPIYRSEEVKLLRAYGGCLGTKSR